MCRCMSAGQLFVQQISAGKSTQFLSPVLDSRHQGQGIIDETESESLSLAAGHV